MTSRRALLIAAAAAAAWLPPARAQTPKGGAKMVRVGIVNVADPQTTTEKTFMGTMRELGWVEGRNVTYDRIYGYNDEARLRAAAAELVDRRPDLIHVQEESTVRAVLARTRDIPIVFGAVNDPLAQGFVKSLARPGGNVTGIGNIGWELGGRRMQLLKEVMPKVTRVAVLSTASALSSSERRLIEQAAGPGLRRLAR